MPKKLKAAFCLTIPILLFVSGCTNPKEASNSTFKAAIQKRFDEQPPGVPVDLPFERPAASFKLARLEALASAGIITRNIITAPDIISKAPQPTIRYELSEQGKPFLYTFSHDSMAGNVREQGISYAQKHVTEIIRYSEPSPAMGRTISHVTYRFELTNVAPWAKDPLIQRALGIEQEVKTAGQTQEATAVLSLMSDGWRVVGGM